MLLTDDEKLDILAEQYLAIMEEANHDMAGIYQKVREMMEKRRGKP
jgi:hypothetical protein